MKITNRIYFVILNVWHRYEEFENWIKKFNDPYSFIF